MNRKFQLQLLTAITLVAAMAMSAYAQPGGGGGRGGRGGGGFGGMGNMMGGGGDARFALRDDVKKELDITEEQTEELQELQQNAPDPRSVMQDLGIDMRSMFQMSREEREKAMAPVAKKLQEVNDEAREGVMEVLTSKQKSRFAELKFQYDVSQGRAAVALETAKIKLDDKDKAELTEAITDAEAQLQQRMTEIRTELYAEAMGKVVSSSKIQQLMGETFNFDSARGGRGGRQGGAARGGGRGGGRQGGDNATNPRSRRGNSDDADADADANPRRRRD